MCESSEERYCTNLTNIAPSTWILSSPKPCFCFVSSWHKINFLKFLVFLKGMESGLF